MTCFLLLGALTETTAEDRAVDDAHEAFSYRIEQYNTESLSDGVSPPPIKAKLQACTKKIHKYDVFYVNTACE